ncbi:alpha-ketoglutarate-dependent dioxygenase AlkB [Piscinibacter gummiphilus]|uniref:Alpha-ketoglutarate-dependent dioxygenase AlkB n=1 Tax=Piscinibacter gummiphilus TaxID=946333 RepID=A0ABZ0CNE6_9BURK|nr:alpha-ketoglutarate-dependent dioxygenase AlkB [Piscinibacter gummiphilus]WOB06498.1 alpha-ketoglutarate-dependent dioxygenase AlkB [Piscinibacter gummiphilus]
MKAPITYVPGFVSSATAATALALLREDLDWVQAPLVPRREYYVGKLPYAYGRGSGRRTYLPQPMHPSIETLWHLAEERAGCKFDVCFLNSYEHSRDHLGWHADDSPEMDDARPIAIVSLGAEREIWFRENGIEHVDRLLLQSGSLCLMPPGMQDTHQHRIPKASNVVGPRISLTLRGYAP